MTTSSSDISIDEYLRELLLPVESAIPHVAGIEMYGDSVPAGRVGGDLVEYINFQHEYDIEARIRNAVKLSKELLESNPPDTPDCNSADDYLEWLRSRPSYRMELEPAYREIRSLDKARIAENLAGLYTTAGVLLVDALGHGLISAKIASTVHDIFHALMLCELDRHGTTTPGLFENLNLRLARSLTARNGLGRVDQPAVREIATLLYGEVQPSGHFRFVNFGHPPPLLFCGRTQKFEAIDTDRMVQFPPLGLEIPQNHPDRMRYTSMGVRQRLASCADVAEIRLMDPGDILVLHTDGVYDGSDEEGRRELEELIGAHSSLSAKEICAAVMEYAAAKDQRLRDDGDGELIDDKTVFVIIRRETELSGTV